MASAPVPHSRFDRSVVHVALAALCAIGVVASTGCGPTGPHKDTLPGLTIADHSKRYFPIDKGPHKVDCAQCHTNTNTFTEFNCVACHQHEPAATNLLHGTVEHYTYKSVDCFACHPKGVQVPPFDHATGQHTCATCHDAGAAFDAFPSTGHPDRGGNDCSACHFSTTDWHDVATFPGALVADAHASVDVTALVPTYAATSIVGVTSVVESLPMPMNHGTAQIDDHTRLDCATCHNETTTYYPGRLHSSLATAGLAQPAQCAECHRTSQPTGFVGPLAADPPRDPASGEMKHDAVVWTNDAPTVSGLVPTECATCHAAPSAGAVITWASAPSGSGAPRFHQPLADAALPEPDSCIDCHANTRPSTTFTSANALLPDGITFDHTTPDAMGDCVSCHASSVNANAAALGGTIASSWSGAHYHDGNPSPSTCLPCHEGERPSATIHDVSTWTDAAFNAAPFDFDGNARGTTHGDGLDCVVCHAQSSSQSPLASSSWSGGSYAHNAGTPADHTCIACHSSQRPDLVLGNAATAASLLGFDHANDGTGDCVGCHQASVVSGAYATYFDPSTGALPGGDWRGGVTYPGNVPIGGLDQFFTITELSLVRSGANNLVTSMTSTTDTIYNAMLHTSAALPAGLNPGSPTNPDASTCIKCHTNDGTQVTSFANGLYHASLTALSIAQPTSHCADCHTAPSHIVEKSASSVVPMDHAIASAVDCSSCHHDPGGVWSDGVLHANLTVPSTVDCTQCHYPTVANSVQSDVTVAAAPGYAMHHASTTITFQNCKTCHAAALTKATQTPSIASLWNPGALHANLSPEPASCTECHANSAPATLTQSATSYTLAQGSTATNAKQWMTHGAREVVGQDCALCHAADATTATTAASNFSAATSFHAAVNAASIASCTACHGNGATPGTGNNEPAGIIDTTTVTSAASDATTGIASGTKDQITHADANVAAHDCNFCHTQTGAASGAVKGHEWAQAQFHARFTASSPLILDGVSGRCSNCHLNVKPGPGFAVDHTAFTNSAGSVDCSSCHSWPGSGTPSSPNWLGAEGGFPQFISVGGFVISQPPETQANVIEPGIASLPHPTVASGTSCAQCHGANSAGGKNAGGYDHASPLINTHCASCHEAGTNLIDTPWNNATDLASGAGDSRPATLGQITVTTAAYPGQSLVVDANNHYYGIDCTECHNTPSGISTKTTGVTYTAAWSFPHDETKMTNPSTCIACHGQNGLFPTGLVDDPNQTVSVNALVPTYSGTSITAVTAQVEPMPMSMDHLTTQVTTTVMDTCTNCHSDTVNYYPGLFHSSLENLKDAQPAQCADCHITALPTGFVGALATNPARTPSSGEMKHDAVAWVNNKPTATSIVPLECSTCHAAPTQNAPSTWQGLPGAPPTFHASLTSAALAQPGSCIDCHANSRASSTFTHATTASIPAGVTFDHTSTLAQGDCVTCHESSSNAYAAWTGGTFHNVGDATPSTCLPCHEGERPTSTSTWVSTTFRNAPFDFVTNANGIKHGDGLDCVVCHTSSGTGQWGVNQNFVGGTFTHASNTVASTTCIACHTTQRADLVLGSASLANTKLGFDHSKDGTGDCFGCHQQTVADGSYVHLLNPSTNTLPGGDWAGGLSYPGATLVGAQDQFVTITETTLVKSGTPSLVRSTTSTSATLYNEMLHTSTALSGVLAAGPPPGDSSTCFNCHTHDTNNNVTSFANGQYHASVTAVGQSQPTTCLDCHAQMRPVGIVEHNASVLEPMDHGAAFTATVTIGGKSVNNVNQVECGVCHHSPGTTWADGKFHANIGSAVPADCTTCHAVEELSAASADVTSATNYVMKHFSSQVTIQNCQTCHTNALARGSQTPLASTQWSGGALHAHVPAQPTACTDCHASDGPATSTQSTVAYTLAKGGTTTNSAQWMSHTTTYVVGKDCAQCHLADATTTVTAWSKSDLFHPKTTGVTTCAVCHGLTNGNGSTVGTKNNMPSGLTDSTTTTSAASDATTGVAAGTKDQIVHTDANVTGHDCNFCHTQVGQGGSNWAAASFHANFTASNPLLTNGTTARCSNCHLNVKPAAGFSFDHSSFTSASGSTDCSSCHSWPGTGSASSPNWLGAAGGYPAFISVGGFTIPQPPATNGTTTEAAVANLPHPTPGATACTACHTSNAGGKNALGYDHASTVENNHCNACHEAGTNLIGTVWNGSTTTAGGAGDSRPISIASLKVTFSGNSLTLNTSACPNGFACGNHFYPVDCYQCHNPPTGVSHVQTGTAYTGSTGWRFPHTESRMSNPSTCHLCHGNNIPN